MLMFNFNINFIKVGIFINGFQRFSTVVSGFLEHGSDVYIYCHMISNVCVLLIIPPSYVLR